MDWDDARPAPANRVRSSIVAERRGGRARSAAPDERLKDEILGIPQGWLVVATGAGHSYFGHEEWEPVAPGLKTGEDALTMRRRIPDAFEQAERQPEFAQEYVTFVVVGAGPTGVELAGAMVEIAVHALAEEFDRIEAQKARVILVEGNGAVLPPYPEQLQESARHQLEDLGVEVRLKSLVVDISERSATLDDGTTIPTRTVLWAAGVTASPRGAMLSEDRDEAGRVPVEPEFVLARASRSLRDRRPRQG